MKFRVRGGIRSPNLATPELPAFTSFELKNFSGSTSKGWYRRGMQFRKGDVPAGAVPVIKLGTTVIDAQFDERNTWEDGSLKVCVGHTRDADFAGSDSRLYTVEPQSGSYDNVSRRTISDITGSHDFKVVFTSVTQFDGTTTSTRGSGSFTASFNTHAAVATRVKMYHSGIVCTSWQVWGMAKDDSTGLEDPHLKTVAYVTAWNNPDGTLGDIEFAFVVTQDWWSVAGKTRLNYTATLKDGSTTIATYSNVYHPYGSQWMTVRKNNDHNHARRHWLTAIPTLYHTFDKKYSRETGLLGYLDPTFIPNSMGGVKDYLPCSSQNHRADVDGTGAYIGRGFMPNPDCIAWMRQMPIDYRAARTNAFAGLHITYHYRSNYNRTIASGPQAGTDTANTVIPLIFRPKAASEYDFTADGMPAAIDAYTGSVSGPATPPFQNTHVKRTGGSAWGPGSSDRWVTGSGTAHAVAYSFFMYMLEGERHFMEATLDLGTATCHQQNLNSLGAAPRASYYQKEPFQTLLSIPNTQYSAIGQHIVGGNIRASGWAIQLQSQADVVCPDNDPQANYIKAFRQQNSEYIAFNLSYMPAEQKALGLYCNFPAGLMEVPYWMSNFICMGQSYGAIACEDENLRIAVTTCTQYAAIQPWESGTSNYRALDYRSIVCYKCTQPYNPVTNPLVPSRQHILTQVDVDIASDRIQSLGVIPPTNGDVIYWIQANATPEQVPIPGGFTEGTPYYLVNVSGYSAQVAASPGGSPMPIEDQSFAITSASMSGTTATYTYSGTAPSWIAAGNRATITGMVPAGYNGTAVIQSAGAGFFTLKKAAGLAASTVGGTISVGYAIGKQMPAAANQAVQTNPPYISPADSYAPISGDALVWASKVPGNAVTPTLLARKTAHLAPVDRSAWCTWSSAA